MTRAIRAGAGGASRPPSARATIAGEKPGVSASVNRDAAAALFAAAGQSLTALIDRAETRDFSAVELTGVTLSLSATETAERTESHNLLARIPGTERPDETVILSAHWDHIGVNPPPATPPADGSTPDLINNGAWDNASGTVAVVEMARALKAAGPQARSIVFLHVTAEEQGLLGSEAYAADPVYPLETTVADINIDMISLAPPTKDLPIFGLGQNTLEDDLQRLAEAQGRTVTDDGQPAQGFYYRSDHFNFARGGVPALMPWHGVDWDEGGRAEGQPAYDARFRGVYHRPADEWSPDWKYDAALEDLTLLYRLVLDLAAGDRWPEWKPGSEFGAVRAESASARQIGQNSQNEAIEQPKL